MKNKILKIGLILGCFSVFQTAFAENKVALVIGNSIYKDKELSLKNPVNDAKDMKAALEKVGFKVIYVENATLDQMDAVREEFRKSLDSDSLALFYYSGHGVQADGINYLIPSDAKIAAKSDLKRRAYDLGYFLDDMGDIQNRANIIIIDACRNNPFKSIRAIGDSKGLTAPTETPKGSIIAYATAPNSVASDNPLERNGIYTKYLKEYLFKPGLKIEDALKEVRKAVMKENDAQIPWENSSLIGDVCLAGCSASNVKPPLIPNEDAEGSPPLLSFVSGAKTVNQNKLYTFKVKASDTDKDLSLVQIDWGDGSELEEKTAKNNGILSFTHKYEFAGIYPLIALALDQAGNVSNEIAKSVSVKSSTSTNPVVTIPSLIFSDISSSSFELGDSVTFSATLSSALPTSYSVKIDYGNGLENMNSSSNRTSFTLGAMPSNSALYHIGIYDNAGKLQGSQVSGSFEVAQPVSESAPTLKLISASNSNEKGKVFTVTLQGSDADGNLSSVAIDWGDGKQDSQAASDGNSVFFNHVYGNSGKFTWSAVAYDDSGLSSTMVSQNLTVNHPAVVNVVAPTIKEVTASPSSTTSGNTVTFAATLNAALPTGYKVKVDYGNGWNDMNAIASSSNPNQLFLLLQTPKKLGLQTFKVGVFDSAGTLKGLAITGTFEIVAPTPVVIETPTPSTTKGEIETFVSGSKTFSYTKIANDGSELPKTAKLGTGAKDWACTKDNNTGLIWEIKTTDGGLRDKGNTYTWYNPDSNTNGGNAGTKNGGSCKESECDTSAYPPAVNKQGLCGAKDWRMPTIHELNALLVCSDGKYNTWDSSNGVDKNLIDCTNYGNVTTPTINTTYFPNTQKSWFWSSSPYANDSSFAWDVNFGYGYANGSSKYSDYFVRLVRG